MGRPIQVTNNVVVTNHWHGIALYGVDNAKVINNTVLPSRSDRMTWITVHTAKDGRPSSHVVVRNNIAGQIVAGGLDVEADHNVAIGRIHGLEIRKVDPAMTNATFSSNLENVPPDSIFKAFDTAHGILDLHLAPKSPALKSGSADGAPAVDIEGRRRIAPLEIGAYAR